MKSEGQMIEETLPGAYQIDVVDSELIGKRVGVVANKASKIHDRHLIDTLLSRKVKLVAAYTPEHGFEMGAEAGEHISDGEYMDTGIQIFSLYGNNRKPNKESLKGVDIMIFDLQDVGVRFFTYISTLHYVMQACAEMDIPLVVLDRPNPNAHYVDGPVLDTNFRSFVGMHTVPVVYGMTIGEYAQMINGEGWLGEDKRCNLTVIPVKNYKHAKEYHLKEIPSPNLPDMQSIYLYPSTCFFEGTILSEGRGTRKPFQIYGHPDYPDRAFSFTPRSIKGASMNPKFKDQVCHGVLLDSIDAFHYGKKNGINLSFLIDAYTKMDAGKEFFIDYFDLLAGNSDLRKQILSGMDEDQIKKTWEEDLDQFKKIRTKYLIYP